MPVAAMGADMAAYGAIGRLVLRGGFATEPGRKVAYRVIRNGQEKAWVLGPDLEWQVPSPGFYRVEVYTYHLRLGHVFVGLRTWIFSNPIALRGPGDGT